MNLETCLRKKQLKIREKTEVKLPHIKKNKYHESDFFLKRRLQRKNLSEKNYAVKPQAFSLNC